MRIICEYNRGRTPLEWIHRYPTAPLIRFREFGIYNYLVLADEGALRDVLVKNSYDFEKPKEVRAAISGMVGHGLVTSEGPDHRALRLAIGSGFNIHSARKFYTVIWQETREFLARLQQDIAKGSSHNPEADGLIDVNNVFRQLFINIIGIRLVGDHWRGVPDGAQKVGDAFGKILEPSLGNIVSFAMYLACPRWISSIISWSNKTARRAAKDDLHALFLSLVLLQQQENAQKERKSSQPNLIDLMIQRHSYTADMITGQIMQDFTSFELLTFTISWCCYELGCDQSFQARLRREVKDALSTKAEGSWSTMESLPLLNAFCLEVLRLHPIAPVTARQVIRDTTIGDVKVSRGTGIIICPYAMGRCSHIWGPRGNEFYPERWIVRDNHGQTKIDPTGGTSSKHASHPFLFGRRECLGKELVMAQIRCVVAAVTEQFSIELQGTTRDNPPPSSLQPGERTVPMEVLHLSMPRTGTVSMQKALAILGIRLYHGGGTTLRRPFDTVRWMQAAEAKFNNQGPQFQLAEWNQLLGDFGAVSNMPCIAFAEDLRAAYPEAKVILIQRDAASWAESFREAFARLYDWRTVLIAR
ncbi:cytochrome P450 [Aspergillus bertholletiae]|uniref:Cytochrome P450 n=1 Tax=Aspergillus bertholletiae TaxID=1226010 RepID=A0A5N7ATW0_9EURO|nr:cytochrome P450 [Aspergillus bertholletiae]